MKKSFATIIFLLILYIFIYVTVVMMQFTYVHMNRIVCLLFNVTALILLIYIIDKIVKKIDNK